MIANRVDIFGQDMNKKPSAAKKAPAVRVLK
jgi:hypothetical protein